MDDLILDTWSQMSQQEREAAAKRLERDLPNGFSFQSIRSYSLGDQRHSIAEFKFKEALFSLIPGGSVTIGYDINRHWEPAPDELESWQDSANEYGIPGSIYDYVADVTLRPRSIHLRPFLIEQLPRQDGWKQISEKEADVQDMLRDLPSHLKIDGINITGIQSGSAIRVQHTSDGTVITQRSQPYTYEAISRQLANDGFRLPTSNEWEYACGAGAQTLFRWGDHVPCDRYPTDINPAEAEWRRQWVLSGGRLHRPVEGFASDWDLHHRPNAFGLQITSTPYHCELLNEPDVTRGGDGGGMICGGAGYFLGWLTLATAYFEEHACQRDPNEPIMPEYTIHRRVFPLD